MKKFALLFFSVVIFSCSNSTDPSTTPQQTYLASAATVNELGVSQIQSLSSEKLGNDASIVNQFLKNGVVLYKLTYNTKDFFGNNIIASGALIIPKDSTKELALVSFQHGTITNNEEAPSNLNSKHEAGFGILLGSAGYIIAMPDYVGYGVSSSLDHPYESRKGLAIPNVDFLKAVKEFIKTKNVKWNNNLLLTGYSEGGYATLATQKLIEEDYSSEFDLVASSCGAGAYNKTATVMDLTANPSVGNPTHNSSYIWVLRTYNTLYNINKPMNYYFKEPYATQISEKGFRVSISESFNNLLNDDLKSRILNGQEITLLNAIKDNDIYDWKPKTPTQLYHGNKDVYVPYLNSETAYQAMQKRGATNVEFKTIPLGTHSSSIIGYLIGTFSFFEKHKND